MADLWATWTPHRYAIPGKTRVRYDFSCPADVSQVGRGSWNDTVGEGTITSFSYEYVGPWNNQQRPIGTYTHHRKYPKGFIVRPDSGGEFCYVPIENAELVSGYRYTIPGFGHAKYRDEFWIGPLPQPLHFYPEDTVQLYPDGSQIERRIGGVSFTGLGTPEYEVLLSDEEVRWENTNRKAAAEARGTSWEICERQTHSYKRGHELTLVSRGNYYHLHQGNPVALEFASLEEEVRFLAHQAGKWLVDEMRPDDAAQAERLTKDAAIRQIEAGTIDLALELVGSFTPIVIHEHFAVFKARARNAGLAYLRAL